MTVSSPIDPTAVSATDGTQASAEEAMLRAAVAHAPQDARAHTALGTHLRRAGRAKEALEHYRRAMYLAPQDGGARYNIATALLDLARPREAMPFLLQALAAEPPHLPALATAGETALRLGDRGAALTWFRQALAVRPDDHASRMGEAVCLLAAGDYLAGWQAFEARLLLPEVLMSVPLIPGRHLTPGEDVAGKTIVLLCEQGYGDSIQFVRYARRLQTKGARVVILAPPNLIELFRGIADEVLPKEMHPAHWDALCPMLSLPYVFGTTLETIPADIPYLAADPAIAARWAARLGPRRGLRVGLAWSGNPAHLMDAERSIPTDLLALLLSVPGIEVHAIQNHGTDALPAGIAVHTDALTDFSETAGLIAQMDLVIAVDTAPAHLAGAIGKPLWLLLARHADFRWLEDRADSPWYPTATLYRQAEGEGWPDVLARVAASLTAIPLPVDAEAEYRRGNALMADNDPIAAEAAYDAAIRANPGHAGALNNRGNALRQQGRLEEAIASYFDALLYRPNYFGTLNNIGSALLALHRPDEAEPILRQALAAKPDYAEAADNLGGALLALGRNAEALTWFRRASALDPGQPTGRFGAACALLAEGEYRAGWRDYEARWDDPRFTEDVPDYPTPRWDGGNFPRGQTMLLHCEQGLGDTLHFVRYAPLVRQRGARVVLQVQDVLAPLVAHLADEVVAQHGEARDNPIPPHDLRCPLMSLPRAFGTRLATIPAAIPYIHADPARAAAWRERLGPPARLRVGVAMSGNPDHPDDILRSIPATTLLAALLPCDAELHLVQKDIRPADAATLAAHPAIRIHADALTDFAETAALLANLDLVVSVDTAPAHLAAAMGRKVLLLVQHAADFRWLRNRTESPWYPTLTLYRQPTRGDWATPLAVLSADIAAAAARFRPS